MGDDTLSSAASLFWGVKGRAVVRLPSEVIAVAQTYEDAVTIAAEHNAAVLDAGGDVQPLADLLKAGEVNATV